MPKLDTLQPISKHIYQHTGHQHVHIQAQLISNSNRSKPGTTSRRNSPPSGNRVEEQRDDGGARDTQVLDTMDRHVGTNMLGNGLQAPAEGKIRCMHLNTGGLHPRGGGGVYIVQSSVNQSGRHTQIYI